MTLLQKHLVFVPLCFVAFAGLFGALVMLLWNWLMPHLFGLPAVSFCQAVGLLVLCKILLGGFGGGHHHGHHGHGCCHSDASRLRERWESMTPEERQRIVEQHTSAAGCADRGQNTDGQ